MSINPDQAIFDAIIAATKDQSLSCGQIVIDTQAFIKTFNGHRDRKLCTSLDVAQAPHKVMTPEEYSAFRITGWHEVCQNVDGFYGVGVRFLGAAQTPPDQFMDDYKRDTTNAMAARILELEALHDEAVANAARWEQRFNDIAQTPRQMTDLVKRLNVYGTGSPDSLLLMREAAARIEELEAALRVQEPDGFANLRAIMADQPYRNSGLSVHEIEVILANKGGFMPDEATVWFREARGKLGIAPEQDK